jgi:hypothetical protein
MYRNLLVKTENLCGKNISSKLEESLEVVER